MGYNARNDEIHENLERMRREREAYEDALAIVRQFNARLSAKKTAWFWPTVAAALASKHHWLIIACDACDTVIDLDLTVKRRDPDASIRVALNDLTWSPPSSVSGPSLADPPAHLERPFHSFHHEILRWHDHWLKEIDHRRFEGAAGEVLGDGRQ